MIDHIMLVDENGRPYIAHAGILSKATSGISSNTRKIHKYIMKIGEGVKARYFYTQEEIKAYQRERALNNAIKGTKKDIEKVEKKAEKIVKKAEPSSINSSKSERMKDEFHKKAVEKADNKSTVSESAKPLESNKTASNGSQSDKEVISEIRRIAANSDKSLTPEKRKELGEKYGLDEKTLNIIDGNLRSPDMKGPRGQKWIDDFIRKKAALNSASDK